MEVRWNKAAYNKYIGTLDFWNKKNKSETYSKKIVSQVENIINEIKNSHPSFLIKTKQPVYRIRFLKYFSLFFTIEEDHINILKFWDGRRNPAELV